MATIDSLAEATVVGDNDLLLIDQGGEGKKLKKGNLKVDADNVSNANGGSVQDFINKVESGYLTVIAANSTIPRSLGERFADVVNVKDFGAKGDGVTDDTQAFINARLASVNVFIPVPSVSYLVNTDQTGNFYSDQDIRFSGDGLITFTNLSKPKVTQEFRCIAHRAYTGSVAENTIPAITKAIRNGADLVELDCQVTSDGIVVLYHDNTLDAQTNGTGAVSANTFAVINNLTYDKLAGTPISTTRIPTLAAALTILSSYRRGCAIEIKGYRTIDDIDLVLDIIASARMQELTYLVVNSMADLERVRSSSRALGQTIPIMIAFANQHTWKGIFNYAKTLGGKYEFVMYHQNIRGGGAGMVRLINTHSRLNAYWLIPNGTINSDSGQIALDMQALGVNSLISDQNIKLGGNHG